MFDTLSDKLSSTLRQLRGQGHITEKNIEQAVRDIRMSLLAADVQFQVVKNFVDNIKAQALGTQVLKNIDAGQQFTQIVHNELVQLLGGGDKEGAKDSSYIHLHGRPSLIFLVGLQGAGKTTTCGKLALYIQKKFQKKVGFLPLDWRRPAAVEQLKQLGGKVQVPVFEVDKVSGFQRWKKIVSGQRQWVQDHMLDVVIVDTAGRTQIDSQLMSELAQQKQHLQPQEVLFVADCMLGQEALNVAREFNKQLGLTGLILSKADGDARGGVVLSVRAQLDLPCRFLGVGEKLTGLQAFEAQRMAGRILGMGDVVGLVEKAQENLDQKEAESIAQRIQSGQINLEDFLAQMKMMKKMGGLHGVMKMLPGLGKQMKQLPSKEELNKQMRTSQAIVHSMTRRERRLPKILNASRRRRIARGSGTQVQDVNKLLRNFEQSQKMLKVMQKPKGGGFDPFSGGGFAPSRRGGAAPFRRRS